MFVFPRFARAGFLLQSPTGPRGSWAHLSLGAGRREQVVVNAATPTSSALHRGRTEAMGHVVVATEVPPVPKGVLMFVLVVGGAVLVALPLRRVDERV